MRLRSERGRPGHRVRRRSLRRRGRHAGRRRHGRSRVRLRRGRYGLGRRRRRGGEWRGREHGRREHGRGRIEGGRVGGRGGSTIIWSQMRRVRELLRVRARDGLVERGAHGDVVRQIGRQSTVEVGRARLQVRRETPVLVGQVVVLLLVHLLVDDILLRHAQGPTRPSLVDLRRSTCRLDSSFETAVAASRRRDVGAGPVSGEILCGSSQLVSPFLILLVGSLRLDGLWRDRDGPLRRHGQCRDSSLIVG